MLDLSTTLLRLIQLATGAVLFGVPLFSLYGPRETGALVTRIIWISLGGMALATVLTVIVQASSLTGSPLAAVSFADLIWYIMETRIGGFNGMRLIGLSAYTALIIAAAPSTVRSTFQTILGGGIFSSFALTGHGVENSWHSFAYFTHVLMAGVWFGALASLCVLLVHASRNSQFIPATVKGLNSFSRVGMVVVALLILSGFGNGLFAVGISDPSALYQSTYGQVLLTKLALLAGMIVLAAANRYRLAPSLERSMTIGTSTDALNILRRSVFSETAIAIIVFGLAAQLASTEPPSV